jgi:hypothetical protein
VGRAKERLYSADERRSPPSRRWRRCQRSPRAGGIPARLTAAGGERTFVSGDLRSDDTVAALEQPHHLTVWPLCGRRHSGPYRGVRHGRSAGFVLSLLHAIEPSREPRAAAVLPVRWHAVLRAPAGGANRVTLTAEDGTTALTTVTAGVEVEITAWRSRRSGPALYRVRTKTGGKEGGAAGPSLERLPPSPSSPARNPEPVARPAVKRAATKAPKRPRQSPR